MRHHGDDPGPSFHPTDVLIMSQWLVRGERGKVYVDILYIYIMHMNIDHSIDHEICTQLSTSPA